MAKTSITITKIVCNNVKGTDDIYVVYQPDCGFPIRVPHGWENNTSMSTNTTWPINVTMEFDNDVLVTLYDADVNLDPFSSDFRVCFDYTPTNIPSSIMLSNLEGVQYTLYATKNS
jgi:hypothetical protein